MCGIMRACVVVERALGAEGGASAGGAADGVLAMGARSPNGFCRTLCEMLRAHPHHDNRPIPPSAYEPRGKVQTHKFAFLGVPPYLLWKL